jgi:hypothetical protein
MKRQALFLLALILVWMGQLSLPRVIADDALDPSWSQAIGQYLALGLQAGRDWSFTYGPLGWFATVVDEPLLWWQRLFLFELLWRLAASTVLVGTLWRLERDWQRWTGVALLALLPLEFDAHAIALLAAGSVLLAGPLRAWQRAGILTLFATLALIKFTLLVAALGALGALCLRRAWRAPALDLGVWLGAILLLWLALGQGLGNLLPWLHHSARIAAAYGSGLSRAPEANQLLLALVFLALQAIVLWRCPAPPALRLALAGLCFVSWKAGLTRGDDHTPYFLGFAALAPWLCGSERLPALRLAASALAVLALALAPEVSRPAPTQWPVLAARRAWAGLTPLHVRAALDSQRAQRAARFDRPRIRALVGDTPLDVYNHHQGVALLNGFSYQPRAIPQSYAALTPQLQQLDVERYRELRPEFVLFRLATIDERFPMHEHSRLLDHYLRAYEPVLSERGDLLLRQSAQAAALTITPIAERTTSWDAWIEVPDAGADQLRMSLDIRTGWAGRIVNLLYRSAELALEVEDDQQRVRRFRIVPELAREPFVLSPLVLGNEGFVALYERSPLPRARRVRLVCPPAFASLQSETIGVGFHRAKLEREPMSGLASRIGASLFERMPVGVDAPRDLLRAEHAGLEKVFSFAPSSLTFALQPTDRRVEARFGLEADPDGAAESRRVGVRVAVVERGQLRLIFERWLEPAAHPGDRGPQSLALDLPAGEADFVLLAATLEETDTVRNAWFWWSGVRILPAR